MNLEDENITDPRGGISTILFLVTNFNQRTDEDPDHYEIKERGGVDHRTRFYFSLKKKRTECKSPTVKQ